MKKFKKLYSLGFMTISIFIMMLGQGLSAYAMTTEQKQIYDSGINDFDLCNPDASGNSASGTQGSGGTGSTSGTPTGGVSFDDSNAENHPGSTTIDDDGIDPSPTGSTDHRGHTSFFDGQLGWKKTNYFVLNTGYAGAHGISAGDVAAITYKGKTVYAIYGDTHDSSTLVWAEIGVGTAIGLTGASPATADVNSLSGVHTTVYPGSHSKLSASPVDQNLINQVGAQVSGAGSVNGSGSTSGTPGSGSGNNNVYLLGNSLLEGAYYDNSFLKTDLTNNGWQPTADASSGRGIATPGVDPSNNRPGHEQSALDAINTDNSDIKSAGVIVIELGTNASNSTADFKSKSETLLSNIKKINGSATIYWVNIFSDVPQKDAYNNVIKGLSGVTVIDTTSLFKGGVIHPDTSGYQQYAKMIADALGKPSASNNSNSNGCCPTNSSASNTATTTPGTLVWPFATKSPSQYNRVDQGWDIQDKPGAGIYAIAAGTLHKSNPNPGAFGNDYPTEELTQSIGGPSNFVYYGHVHMDASLDGKPVVAGQLIAHANTTDPQNGSVAPPGWLEIGFANSTQGDPVAKSIPSPEGQKMKDLLKDAKPGNGATASSSASPTNATSCCPTSGASGGTGVPTTLVGKDNHEKAFNFFIQVGLSPAQAAGVVANLINESGVDPTWAGSSPSSGSDFGIASWHPGIKFDGDKNFNHITGNDADLLTQLIVLWAEMQGHSNQGFNVDVVAGLKKITGNDAAAAGQAAIYFRDNFERCDTSGATPSCSDRESVGESVFRQYGNNSSVGSATTAGVCNATGNFQGTCTAKGIAYTRVLSQAELEKVFGVADGHTNIISGTFFGGAVQMNKKVMPCLQAVEQDLKAQGTTYTIKSPTTIPSLRWPPDSLAFYHPYGAAIDVNPDQNPMCGQYDPLNLCHNGVATHDIPDAWIKTFAKYGFYWGGNWSIGSRDLMHFEWHGENP